MHASEEKYRNLFENSLMGISTSSPNGHLIQINQAYARMYGYNNPEEMLSEVKNVERLYVNQEDRKEVLRTLAKNDIMEPKEFEVFKRDKTRIFVLVSVRSFRDESGKLIYRQATHMDITEQKKVHEEIIESKKQLEELYKHLNEARENERMEISREIHDELGQTLTALKIDLNWTMEKIPADVLIHKKIKSMIDIVSDTIKKVQKISSDLRPGMLDDLGLTASLEWYSKECEKRSNFTCMLALDEIPNLNSKIKLVLFRVFQEGMTNIIRHANAKKVKVKLHSSSSGILLKISDDGIGISKKKTTMKDSLGLIGMKERLREFNGTLEIISSKNNGTGLVINIPIVKQEELCLY
jgi:PAS domain S-box-containing protein